MPQGQGLGTLHVSKLIPKTSVAATTRRRDGNNDGNSLSQAAARARDFFAKALKSAQGQMPTDVDWRKQVRQYPVASGLGAFGVGLLLGYSLNFSSKQNRKQPRVARSSKPSLANRFKETSAFGKLQNEASVIGNRFIDELSKLAHDVAVPAVTNKLSGMVGSDPRDQSQPIAK